MRLNKNFKLLLKFSYPPAALTGRLFICPNQTIHIQSNQLKFNKGGEKLVRQ